MTTRTEKRLNEAEITTLYTAFDLVSLRTQKLIPVDSLAYRDMEGILLEAQCLSLLSMAIYWIDGVVGDASYSNVGTADNPVIEIDTKDLIASYYDAQDGARFWCARKCRVFMKAIRRMIPPVKPTEEGKVLHSLGCGEVLSINNVNYLGFNKCLQGAVARLEKKGIKINRGLAPKIKKNGQPSTYYLFLREDNLACTISLLVNLGYRFPIPPAEIFTLTPIKQAA